HFVDVERCDVVEYEAHQENHTGNGLQIVAGIGEISVIQVLQLRLKVVVDVHTQGNAVHVLLQGLVLRLAAVGGVTGEHLRVIGQQKQLVRRVSSQIAQPAEQVAVQGVLRLFCGSILRSPIAGASEVRALVSGAFRSVVILGGPKRIKLQEGGKLTLDASQYVFQTAFQIVLFAAVAACAVELLQY